MVDATGTAILLSRVNNTMTVVGPTGAVLASNSLAIANSSSSALGDDGVFYFGARLRERNLADPAPGLYF